MKRVAFICLSFQEQFATDIVSSLFICKKNSHLLLSLVVSLGALCFGMETLHDNEASKFDYCEEGHGTRHSQAQAHQPSHKSQCACYTSLIVMITNTQPILPLKRLKFKRWKSAELSSFCTSKRNHIMFSLQLFCIVLYRQRTQCSISLCEKLMLNHVIK
jgi:hypothetical protein